MYSLPSTPTVSYAVVHGVTPEAHSHSFKVCRVRSEMNGTSDEPPSCSEAQSDFPKAAPAAMSKAGLLSLCDSPQPLCQP